MSMNKEIFKHLHDKNPAEIFGDLPTPCYIIDEEALINNAKILSNLIEQTGCKILLAQKAFSNYDFYPLLTKYLSGTEASGLYEARLGKEQMPDGEVHVFCGAYSESEFPEVLKYADHIVFNSPNQVKRFGKIAKKAGKSIGLRINPECSTQEGHEIYDPCAKGSRLGTTRESWDLHMTQELVSLLDGLHFHTLCQQNSDSLEMTINAVEEKFADVLPLMKWVNMGGGHHITRENYDIDLLIKCIERVKTNWEVQVYLEPGEAVALNAGYLATRVLDTIENNGTNIAIIDASAACHMPDVIEMPYTPPLYDAVEKTNQTENVYRLGGPTCLAGDIVGDYVFKNSLKYGDLLLFGDMAIYSTCKNNTFNGMPLPSIWKKTIDNKLIKLVDFDYQDFKSRLGSK